MFSLDRQNNTHNSQDKAKLDDTKFNAHALADLWARASSRLRAELGEDVYSSWFMRIELQDITNDTAHLTVSTRFLKSWVETHYKKNILAALNHELAQEKSSVEIFHIMFSVRAGIKTIIAQENLAKDTLSTKYDKFAKELGHNQTSPTTLIRLEGKFVSGQTSQAAHTANASNSSPSHQSTKGQSKHDGVSINPLEQLSAKIRQRASASDNTKHGGQRAQSKDVAKDASRAQSDKTMSPTPAEGRANQPSYQSKRLIEDALHGSPLDRRMTFSNFVVGRNNAIAFAAAKRVIDTVGAGSSLYNPLFIHANVGLGKTHLLQAIAHEVGGRGKRVTYLTAEKFMYGFVSALKSQSAIAFKDRLRAIDMLIIDDIQFLQGKVIQTEFCHSLNALIDVGRQIVIASDRTPQDLEQLEERVRSRLGGGLSIEIGSLDEAMRLEILSMRIAQSQLIHPDFFVPQDVLAFVARNIATNGRDLDGAVNRLIAHATLTATPLTIETAEIAVRDLVRMSEPKRIKIEDIQRVVSNHYQVNREDVLSARRTSVVVRPRQIAMYLSKALTPRSLPEIGRRFGNRDHTTVLHAVRKIDEMMKTDAGLCEEINLLKRMLME